MKLFKDSNKNIDYIKKINGSSSDIVSRDIKISGKNISYIFLESVCSDDKISNFFMKDISNLVSTKRINLFNSLFKTLKNSIPNSNLKTINDLDDVFYHLASGFTCLFIDGSREAIVFETRFKLNRGITESTTEAVVRGPKDSFTENNAINLGLIRKRIKDPNLTFTERIIGERTKTKVTVGYIDDLADKEIVNKVLDKLNKIDIRGIIDSGYIGDFLVKKETIFPKYRSTDRPDTACLALLDGKIVILVENSPFVLVTPTLFIDFFVTTEDKYQKSTNVNFTRMIRIIGFFITLLTPGLYIALTTFNPEVIPNELLISISAQREGVPFSTPFSIVLMLITFEIMRECDVRVPSSIGSAVSIIGALVLGEAAVSAGIVSAIVIIIVAGTAICGLLFSDIDFVNAIRVWRLIIIIFSSIFGLIGFLISMLLFTTKICSIETGDISYLTPFAPFKLNFLNFVFEGKKSKEKKRI